MSKKAQGMSINVIIIAAIALLILIILAVLVLRTGNRVRQGTGCTGGGGECWSSCDDATAQMGGLWSRDPTNDGTSGNCQEGEQCCVQISKPAVE
jgi:hypothetical protein